MSSCACDNKVDALTLNERQAFCSCLAEGDVGIIFFRRGGFSLFDHAVGRICPNDLGESRESAGNDSMSASQIDT